MACKPRLAFDTSTLNRLVKDSDSEPYIAAILCGFEVRLPEMSVGEVYATRDPALRRKLFVVCRRLLGVGQAIKPAHWVLDSLIKQHHEDPKKFDWKQVPVRALGVENQICSGELLNDERLVAEQSEGMRSLQDSFEKMFEEPRNKLKADFDSGSDKRPEDFSEYLRRIQFTGGRFWHFAQMLYEECANVVPDESTTRKFIDECPPFRAFLYALALTWFDRCIRQPGTEPRFSAGRNDQMMSVYLPYCDQFITAEKKGMQEQCLREGAAAANVSVVVRSYDDFCGSFLVTH